MVLFDLKNVSFDFSPRSTQHAARNTLHEISLSIQTNRMTAIMGLNGAGKTTLLKLLGGFLKPSQGQITFLDKPIASFKPRELAQNITWIAQDFSQDFPFTVKEIVLMGRFAWQQGLFNSREDYDIVTATLDRLNLSAFADRSIDTLSGGERQRVLIARALAQQSPVILLDEPTNHLDIKHKTEVFELLKNEVKTGGKSVVAVIHDLSDARRYFDEVVLLKEGRVEFAGPVAEGLSAPWVKRVFEVEFA